MLRTPDLLQSLLGAEAPELNCEECFEKLDYYVEAELREIDADRAVPGMRPHLEGCSACAEDHQSLRALLQAEVRFSEGAVGRLK